MLDWKLVFGKLPLNSLRLSSATEKEKNNKKREAFSPDALNIHSQELPQAAQHSRAAPMGVCRWPCSPSGCSVTKRYSRRSLAFKTEIFPRSPHWARLLQLIMAAVIWKQCILFLFCFFGCHIAMVECFFAINLLRCLWISLESPEFFRPHTDFYLKLTFVF